jgi:CheY-like chemotaxis protein
MNDHAVVLVVDDNAPIVQTLIDILELKGYTVFSAHSGSEALEILQNQGVNILLTDVIMPDMDGVSLYRQAKKIQPRLVAFLMTAYSADEIIRQGITEGIRTVLNKPLDLNLLLALLAAVEKAYIHQ